MPILSQILNLIFQIGIERRNNNKIPKEMATVYAGLINQYNPKYHILFSASFYKID